MTTGTEFDAYSPPDIAARVSALGISKVEQPFAKMMTLAILGGAFIALGALYFALVTSDTTLTYALSRVIGGVVFSLGLVLVVVAGAELFTGNNLLVMAWADGKITSRQLLRDWAIVFVGNALGALAIVALAIAAGLGDLNGHAVARHAVQIATAKAALPFGQALAAGILCNILVCLAIWLAMAGRTVIDKIAAIVLPISAFVAAGFEHSVANFFFFGLGAIYSWGVPVIDALGIAKNLVAVTLGNLIGGAVLVGLVYHFIYRRA